MKMKTGNILKKAYFKSTGYSYTNMGRLFLRLFLGVMLMQFGIRQIIHFDALDFPAVLGMSSEVSLVVMIMIEIVCSVFVMCGFLTRIMLLPPFVAMTMAEYELLKNGLSDAIPVWTAPGYLPIMFLGIIFFLILVGPGKISIDYFLSLYLLHSENRNEEEELEEV